MPAIRTKLASISCPSCARYGPNLLRAGTITSWPRHSSASSAVSGRGGWSRCAMMAAFPNGENDDLHDAAVYGLLRIRQGGLMRLSTDLEAEYQPRRPTEYY